MFALRQVKTPFYRKHGRQRGRDFTALAQSFGLSAIPLLHKNIVPAAKRLIADLSHLAVTEIEEVVSVGQSFKTATKMVGRQTLKKQLLSGSRQKSVSQLVPTKSAKQTSCSQKNVFTNVSQYSCKVFFGTSLLWQFPEILERSSILYSKPLREYKKPKYKVGESVCVSKYDLPSGTVISHSLHWNF